MKTHPRLLVAYTTSEGQTRRVARFVANHLRDLGFAPTLADLAQTDPDPARYDAVVACASVHSEKHQPALVGWARIHAATLVGLPSAFLSVSMSAARDTPADRDRVQTYLEQFVQHTGWTPGALLPVAGALRYTQYGFLKTYVMRSIARRNNTQATATSGDPLDVTRDHEFTNWKALEAFAAQFAERVRTEMKRRRPRPKASAAA